MMIVTVLRPVAAALLLFSGAAAFGQSLPTPPAGYNPPPQPWAMFDFTVGSNNNVQDGNARYFTATSSRYGTFNVRATAWSLETVCNGFTYGSVCYGTKTTTIRDSKLMVYDGGLGVISADDDGGANGQHTIDNEGRKDFIVFQFDRNVQLVAATFNTYSVNGASSMDSDVTVMYGNTNIGWNSSLASTLNDKPVSDTSTDILDTLFQGSYVSNTTASGDNARWMNTGGQWGNIWLIGASFANPDSKIDGFKLETLSVVPEPQTWALMIAGFGLVGGTMRSPRRRSALLQA